MALASYWLITNRRWRLNRTIIDALLAEVRMKYANRIPIGRWKNGKMMMMTNTNKTKDDYDLPLLMKKRELVLHKIAHLKMILNEQEDDLIEVEGKLVKTNFMLDSQEAALKKINEAIKEMSNGRI